jgi:hypothetical protein
VQLGAGSLKESARSQRKSERQRELALLARLDSGNDDGAALPAAAVSIRVRNVESK